MGLFRVMERYKLKCAVFLILSKNVGDREFILLQRRFNTGLLDGMYDVSCSGHLEVGEGLKSALIREANEEIGIEIKKENLHFSSVTHANFNGDEYILASFSCNVYDGVCRIMEANKCDDLTWFPVDELPSNLIETRKVMIDNYLNGNSYSEYNFK